VSGFPTSFGAGFFTSPPAPPASPRPVPAPALAGEGSLPERGASSVASTAASDVITQEQVQGSLLLPDIPNPDNGQWAADCGAYAFDKVCGYAATVCFLGKVAGVVGSDEEIEQARHVFKSAFAELGKVLFGGSDDIRALRAEQRQLQQRLSENRRLGSMIGPGIMDRTAQGQEAHYHARLAASQTGDFSKIDALRQLTRQTLFGGDVRIYSDAYLDNLKETLLLENRLKEVEQKRRLLGDRDVGDVIADYFKGLWDDLKKIYHELEENIRKGRWKYGLCKASLDTGLFILEEGVSLAVVTALTALGLGAAGVLVKISATVVAQGVKVARRLSDVKHVRLNVSFTRHHERGQPFDAHGPQQVSRNTDIKPHELTDEHKKLFDENYQGNLDATPDVNKPPTSKGGSDAPSSTTRHGSIRERLGLKNITDEEIVLAGQAGESIAQQDARKRLVQSFAEATGAKDKLHDMIGQKSGGMNLNHPIRIVDLPKGTRVTQWVDANHGTPGNWFDPSGTAHPSALGISPKDRMSNIFVMKKDGFAIESIANPIKVSWGVDKGYDAVGGAKQLFVPEKYKPQKSDQIGSTRVHWRDIERAGLYKIDPNSKEKLDIFNNKNIKINMEDIN